MKNVKINIGNLLIAAASCYSIFKTGCAIGEMRSGKEKVSIVDLPFLKINLTRNG